MGESSDDHKWYMVLLRIVSFPLWIADKGELGDELRFTFTTKYVVAGYVGFALLLVVVAAVLALGARGLGERAGGFTAFVLGWFSLVLGGTVFGLTVFTIVHDDDAPRLSAGGFEDAMSQMQAGAYFGVLTGWLVGLAAVAAYGASASYGPPPGPLGGGGYVQPNVFSQPTSYGPAYGVPSAPGAPAAPGHPGYGRPPQAPYDAPTTIRPAGPPPAAPPRRPGSTDTPPGGYRP